MVFANEVIADATDIDGIAKVQKLVLDDVGGIASDIKTVASSTTTYTAETKGEIETDVLTADIAGNQLFYYFFDYKLNIRKYQCCFNLNID